MPAKIKLRQLVFEHPLTYSGCLLAYLLVSAISYKLFFIHTDTKPPSFSNTCPTHKTVEIESCSSSALVSWSIPVATDNSGSVDVQQPSFKPPVLLNLGTHMINYTASDAAGNTRSCIFKIQVMSKSLIPFSVIKTYNYYNNFFPFNQGIA